ncbi:hypothetical protein J2X71_001305 [Rhizobium sp. 1399]|nr:hypothetical protein [Rhizobium sp. 1399]
MSSTVSANVDGRTATKLKMVASMENRSVSNAVSSAITVFVGLPKEGHQANGRIQDQGNQNGRDARGNACHD